MCELNKKDEFINIKTTNKRWWKRIYNILRDIGIYWDQKETEKKRTKRTETSNYLEEKK